MAYGFVVENITVAQAALLLGVSKPRVHQMMDAKILRPVGTRPLVMRTADVMRVLAERVAASDVPKHFAAISAVLHRYQRDLDVVREILNQASRGTWSASTKQEAVTT